MRLKRLALLLFVAACSHGQTGTVAFGAAGPFSRAYGLANKQGITCLNSPGTIDSDYRGEVKVILINLSGEEHTINHGDRIAQMVIQPVHRANWMAVETLNESKRGPGGFGHTGK